jgi:hypothetical protein
VFSAREPAERSSDPTLEVIQGLATAHWSVVTAAGGAFVVGVWKALQKLGHPFCHPLYAFVFRPGCAPVEAQELTQGIFTKLLLLG